MNSVKDVNITESASRMIDTTQEHWSCSAPSTRTKAGARSEHAVTTATAARVEKKAVCLKPSDPYPTWPFTQIEPKSLARWCRKNVKSVYQIEEALL